MLLSHKFIVPAKTLTWSFSALLIMLLFARGLLIEIPILVAWIEATFFEFLRAVARVFIGDRKCWAFVLAVVLEILGAVAIGAAIRQYAPLKPAQRQQLHEVRP